MFAQNWGGRNGDGDRRVKDEEAFFLFHHCSSVDRGPVRPKNTYFGPTWRDFNIVAAAQRWRISFALFGRLGRDYKADDLVSGGKGM